MSTCITVFLRIDAEADRIVKRLSPGFLAGAFGITFTSRRGRVDARIWRDRREDAGSQWRETGPNTGPDWRRLNGRTATSYAMLQAISTLAERHRLAVSVSRDGEAIALRRGASMFDMKERIEGVIALL